MLILSNIYYNSTNKFLHTPCAKVIVKTASKAGFIFAQDTALICLILFENPSIYTHNNVYERE